MAPSALRGRQADRPSEIPRSGWRDVLLRTRDQISDDHVSMVAGGVAFYGLLALFPGIAAMIAIWGLLFDPQQVERQIAGMSGLLPQDAAAIVTDQARTVAAGGTGFSLAAIGGILFALYSASKGMKALIEGLNIVYDEEEERGFLKLNLLALALTLAVIVAMLAALGLIVVAPALLGSLGFGALVQTVVDLLRWPVLFVGAMLVLAALYRYAPSRAAPRWRWVSWGAAIATAVWLIGSIGFSVYVSNFASYNETYGSIGAVIILLMWFWLSAFIVLLGAELNGEMEHQTERDSTTGPAQPLGERGAYVADHVAETP